MQPRLRHSQLTIHRGGRNRQHRCGLVIRQPAEKQHSTTLLFRSSSAASRSRDSSRASRSSLRSAVNEDRLVKCHVLKSRSSFLPVIGARMIYEDVAASLAPPRRRNEPDPANCDPNPQAADRPHGPARWHAACDSGAPTKDSAPRACEADRKPAAPARRTHLCRPRRAAGAAA